MIKFKIGDKVRIIGGQEGFITSIAKQENCYNIYILHEDIMTTEFAWVLTKI